MGSFQNIFKNMRVSSGYTQAEIAEKLGVSRSTIGMYETGAREPDFETLEAIADLFNVDTDYLLGRTNKTTLLPETVGHYYMNDETREIAQEVFENPDLRSLFHVARDIEPEELRAHIDFMKRLKARERGNDIEGC
ncbi:MAG: helix-turn-helix domain-containing protein [bacterium]|nr:helix-turn-helix domain-containing protein [bacterium]